jgi:hypothetical protein
MKLFKTLLLTLVIPVFSIGQESAYTPGEKVNYAVHYGIVQGGQHRLSLKLTLKGKMYGTLSSLAEQPAWLMQFQGI